MPDYSEQLNQARKKYSAKTGKRKTKLAKPETDISGIEFLLIGSIAVASDACDYVGLDLLLFRAIDLTTSGILGLWCLMRLHEFPSARFGGTLLIELIPGLGDISPTWTIFIISVYLKQKKNE